MERSSYLLQPNTPDFKEEINLRVEELLNQGLPEQNYTEDDELAYTIGEKIDLPHIGNVTIIKKSQTNEKLFWKEIILENEKEIMASLIAFCEYRKRANETLGENVVKFERLMYKQKKKDSFFPSWFYRCRLMFQYSKYTLFQEITHSKPDQKTSSPFIREMFVDCLNALVHLHEKKIYILDLRPELIVFNNEDDGGQLRKDFRILDPLYDCADPYSRIRKAIDSKQKLYLNPTIFRVYMQGQENEEAMKAKRDDRKVKEGIDVYSLAMITLELCLKLPQSHYYLYDGGFNIDLIKERIRKLKEERGKELDSLCNAVEHILLTETVKHVKSAREVLDNMNDVIHNNLGFLEQNAEQTNCCLI